MPDPTADRLTIDIISDVVCPWCYIGKRRLEIALRQLAAQEPALQPFVSWHPFQLNPELPREGIDRRAYVEGKFGGPQRAREVYERLREVGAAVGIPFAFDAIARQPNTRDTHRLISWAQARGDADALVERLFRAYFLDGRFIGDHAVLAAIAGEAGLDADAARAYLATAQGDDTIVAMDRRVRELGIGGVPFFIFEGRVGVSGAQEPQALLDAIAQARDSSPANA